jgi:hypothetical protein
LRTVASVLADIERYREWLPGVERARVLASENETRVVEVAAARWGRGRSLFDVALQADGDVHFRQVGRFRGSGVSGVVDLTEVDEGVQLRVEVSAPMPGWFGRARRDLARAVAEASHALDLRVQSAVLGTLTASSSRPRSLLEVRRDDDGYRLWFQGKSWRLSAVEDAREPSES